jgi:hypothetical protein
MKSFNLQKLNMAEDKKLYHVEIPNLDAQIDINRTWETTRENTKVSTKESIYYYELKMPRHSLIKDVHNYQTKGTEHNCSDYRIQAK